MGLRRLGGYIARERHSAVLVAHGVRKRAGDKGRSLKQGEEVV